MGQLKPWRIFSLSVFAFLITRASVASILITQPAPYPTHTIGDTGYTLYVAGNAAGAPVSSGIKNPNFTYIPTGSGSVTLKDPAYLIQLDIRSNDTFNVASGKQLLLTLSSKSDSSADGIIYIRYAGIASGSLSTSNLPPACLSSGACNGADGGDTARFQSVSYTANSTIRVAFSLADLCNTGATGTLCAGSAYTTLNNTSLTQTIYATFGVVDSGTVLAPGGSGAGDVKTNSVPFVVTDIPPLLSVSACPSEVDYYFPGDEEIRVRTSSFSNTGNSGAPVNKLVFMAKQGATVDELTTASTAALNSNNVVAYLNTAVASEFVSGFVNLLPYTGIVYAQNAAGIISPNTATTGYCKLSGIQSQPISGVLDESKCFIATAAFQDGRAPPVMLLREFRDQVLSKSPLGREFIKKYYRYSPRLARWAWNKPLIRSIALRALAPLEFVAWLWLKIANAEDLEPSGEMSERYIDRLRKRIAEEEGAIAPSGPRSSESYTEKQKKELGPSSEEPSKDYSAEQKKLLSTQESNEKSEEKSAAESSQGYSDRQRELLGPAKDRESVITRVQEGRDAPLGMGEMPPVETALSFKLGVDPGLEVTGGGRSFTDVYGSDWKPDFWFHYERQFLRSETWGSIAYGGDIGFNYSGGYGLLQQQFNGSLVSETPFSFLQIPVIPVGVLRLNVLRFLQPYVTAGLGAIFYSELRKDSKPDKHGYGFVYQTSLGLSVMLDFLDRKTSREAYLGSQIQNTYFYLEYLYLGTLSSGVQFKRSGIYSGFMFEY